MSVSNPLIDALNRAIDRMEIPQAAPTVTESTSDFVAVDEFTGDNYAGETNHCFKFRAVVQGAHYAIDISVAPISRDPSNPDKISIGAYTPVGSMVLGSEEWVSFKTGILICPDEAHVVEESEE